MCGVIYFKGDGEQYKPLIISLLQESRIRGLHAFGVSLIPSGKKRWETKRTFTIDEAISFIERCSGFRELIGHTRYDTSGDWNILENNQPIEVKDDLLVFNGVVRMSLKKEYEREFKTKYTTANDGEIPLRMMAEGRSEAALALLSEAQVSFAGVFRVGGRSFALRNERRPLWYWKAPDTTFVVSTRDIWVRAAKKVKIYGEPIYYDPSFLEPVPPMEVLWL